MDGPHKSELHHVASESVFVNPELPDWYASAWRRREGGDRAWTRQW